MASIVKVISTLLKVEQEAGQYIISPSSNPFEEWAKARYRDRCDEFANLPLWARLLSGSAAGSISRICKPYFDQEGTDGPVNPGPAFSGGQCPEVVYTANVAGPGSPPGGPGIADRQGTGPVGGMCFIDAGFGNTSIGVLFNGVCVIAGGGQGTTVPSVQGQWNIVSIVRADGLPDDCGDPPDAPLIPGPNPPPNPGPLPGPEPTDNPDGGPIPIIPIPPYDDPTFGPQPYDPGPDGGGGGEPAPPPPPAGGDGLPGSPDSVTPPVGTTGNDGEGEDFDFGPPPAGKVWIGVLIQNTVDSRFGNIPGTGPQNTVYPYVIGNASLIYSGGFSSSSRMRSRWHEMFRPVTALEVTGARVQCRPGVSASVRPVSATICPENTCGENNNG